jgi:hypothetical protein
LSEAARKIRTRKVCFFFSVLTPEPLTAQVDRSLAAGVGRSIACAGRKKRLRPDLLLD